MTPDQILDEQEPRLHLKEMALDRFGCGGWPEEVSPPSTPGDFLAWIEDEIDLQIDMTEDFNEPQRKPYIDDMQDVATKLRLAGIRPTPLPWEA